MTDTPTPAVQALTALLAETIRTSGATPGLAKHALTRVLGALIGASDIDEAARRRELDVVRDTVANYATPDVAAELGFALSRHVVN
jgi:hypothetical protein